MKVDAYLATLKDLKNFLRIGCLPYKTPHYHFHRRRPGGTHPSGRQAGKIDL